MKRRGGQCRWSKPPGALLQNEEMGAVDERSSQPVRAQARCLPKAKHMHDSMYRSHMSDEGTGSPHVECHIPNALMSCAHTLLSGRIKHTLVCNKFCRSNLHKLVCFMNPHSLHNPECKLDKIEQCWSRLCQLARRCICATMACVHVRLQRQSQAC